VRYKVSLNIFEGPIELLLYLVKKERIDIFDIPIARITEEYFNYLRALRDKKLHHLGDFLIIASILLRYKLSSLLPTEEKPEPLPLSLPRVFSEFIEYKRAALFLSEQERKSRLSLPRKAELYYEYREGEDIATLLSVFNELLKRRVWEEPLRMSGYRVSVEEMMNRLRKRLKGKGNMDLKELLLTCSEIIEALTLFLAILELVRLGEISIHQSRPFSPIVLISKCPEE